MYNEGSLKAAMEAAILVEVAASTSTFSPEANSRAYKCGVSSCDRQGYASGYCNAHYVRKASGKDMTAPLRARKRDDKCKECGEGTGAKGGWGLCPRHYRSKRTYTLKNALVSEMGGCCSTCSSKFPLAVYDFHHIGSKDDSPAYLIGNASISRIAAEISKCVLLCANCHRMEHNNEY